MKRKELAIVDELIKDHSELLKSIEEIIKLTKTIQVNIGKAKISSDFFNVLKDAIYLSFKISSLMAKLNEHMKLEEKLIRLSLQDLWLERELNTLIDGIKRFSEIEREISKTLESYHKGAITLDIVVETFIKFVNELQEIVYKHVTISDKVLHVVREYLT